MKLISLLLTVFLLESCTSYVQVGSKFSYFHPKKSELRFKLVKNFSPNRGTCSGEDHFAYLNIKDVSKLVKGKTIALNDSSVLVPKYDYLTTWVWGIDSNYVAEFSGNIKILKVERSKIKVKSNFTILNPIRKKRIKFSSTEWFREASF